MLQFWKTKTFLGVAIVALLVALYAVGGFIVAPKLVRSALLENIPKNIYATPTVGEIHINPFLLQLTVKDFSLSGDDGKLLGFQQLFIDFELSSLWHRAYSFANIDIAAPYVNAAMSKSGKLNLLKLQPKPGASPPPAPGSKPLPPLRIGSFKVSQGLVTYLDNSRPDAFAARLEPINFELRDFTTGVEGGRFTFTGASKLGERVEWHGHVSVDPIESDGEFQIDGLLAHTLWEYLQDQVNFVINTGKLDLAATYKFALPPAGQSGAASFKVDLSKVTLTDLAVRPKESETDWITLPELAVNGTSVDVTNHQAHVDEVLVNRLKVSAWLEPDGSVNLMKLAASPSAASGAAASGTAGSGSAGSAAAPPASATPVAPTLTASPNASAAVTPWRYDVVHFALRDAAISVEDRSVKPAVKVALAPLSIRVDGASQDLGKPVDVLFDTHINEGGTLSAGGEVTPQPLSADMTLKLAGLDITPVQPYVAQHTAMTLLGGTVGARGKVHYGILKDAPSIQFAGDIDVEKVHTVDNALRDDFIDWDRVDIVGLNYSSNPARIDIDQVTARKLYARVIIESDASMNVKRVLNIPNAPAAGAAPTAAAPAAAAPAAAAPAGAAARRGNAVAAAPKRGAKSAARVAGAQPAQPAPTPMSIKNVVLQASQANFTDMSVAPNFSAGIQALQGTIVGLSSKPGSRAKVDLKGQVDPFSPVSITGDVNVLGPLYTDLSLNFSNISLAVFNPYSGKFAGYNITKGKLNTQLHYKVDGRSLDAQHHIVVEDLEFGDKTASKDAVSLPIKLAVALLKDRNGTIDLNIPVTGSLDDPQFKLAPIIWKVFVNILEKAVTAPFALLGALFGGGPDLQFIDFQPGVGTLDAAGADKVKTVAKALIERPQLKIDVPIGTAADLDRPALVEAKFNDELAAAQTAKSAPKKAAAAGATPPAFAQLDAATQADVLAQVYARDFGTEPKYPDSITAIKAKPDIAAAKITFLGKAIRDHIVIGDNDLQTLGQQRAATLQQLLLADSQVTPERVFLTANDKAAAKDGAVRLELSLE